MPATGDELRVELPAQGYTVQPGDTLSVIAEEHGVPLAQLMQVNRLANPDAVFIGGGLSHQLLDALWAKVAPGCRIVANTVTVESEALLAEWHAQVGGTLQRLQLSQAAPIGRRRAWQSSYPIVQWSVTR